MSALLVASANSYTLD